MASNPRRNVAWPKAIRFMGKVRSIVSLIESGEVFLAYAGSSADCWAMYLVNDKKRSFKQQVSPIYSKESGDTRKRMFEACARAYGIHNVPVINLGREHPTAGFFWPTFEGALSGAETNMAAFVPPAPATEAVADATPAETKKANPLKPTIAHKIEILTAYRDRKEIEYKTMTGTWSRVWPMAETYDEAKEPSFNFHCTEYRIKPAEPDFIVWTHVHERFRFMARDADGTVTLYANRPIIQTGTSKWVEGFHPSFEEGPSFIDAHAFSTYRRGGQPWALSLVERKVD